MFAEDRGNRENGKTFFFLGEQFSESKNTQNDKTVKQFYRLTGKRERRTSQRENLAVNRLSSWNLRRKTWRNGAQRVPPLNQQLRKSLLSEYCGLCLVLFATPVRAPVRFPNHM